MTILNCKKAAQNTPNEFIKLDVKTGHQNKYALS